MRRLPKVTQLAGGRTGSLGPELISPSAMLCSILLLRENFTLPVYFRIHIGFPGRQLFKNVD